MPDYPAIAAKVRTALGKAGAPVILRKATPGTFDPATGAYIGGSTTDYVAVGLIQAPQSTSGSIGQRYFNGVEVKTDDVFILLAVPEAVPEAGDLLEIDDVFYTVTTLLPVRPGGVALMYRVMARR